LRSLKERCGIKADVDEVKFVQFVGVGRYPQLGIAGNARLSVDSIAIRVPNALPQKAQYPLWVLAVQKRSGAAMA
jgi:hypothetical protein